MTGPCGGEQAGQADLVLHRDPLCQTSAGSSQVILTTWDGRRSFRMVCDIYCLRKPNKYWRKKKSIRGNCMKKFLAQNFAHWKIFLSNFNPVFHMFFWRQFRPFCTVIPRQVNKLAFSPKFLRAIFVPKTENDLCENWYRRNWNFCFNATEGNQWYGTATKRSITERLCHKT